MRYRFCYFNFRSVFLPALFLSISFLLQAAGKPNVLFIIVDDLRPEMGCYGSGAAQTPQLDALAKRALVFDRAYCQEAVCMSSRNSMLSGFRPDARGIWTNRDVRDKLQDIDFFPAHFRKSGYHSIGIGKIAHNSWEDPRCWSEEHLKPENIAYEYRTHAGRKIVEQMQQEAKAAGQPDPFRGIPEKIRRGMAWESHDVDDRALGDGQIADLAIEALNRIRDREEPLFLAIGFLRPHLPFVAPKKYWDLYDPNNLPVPAVPAFPEGAPQEGSNRSRELLNQYRDLPVKTPLDVKTSEKLVHGYLASVSYVDAQIGRVLKALRDLEMEDNTIVIVTSDHGFHLGDQSQWGKATNFELSTRVPLLIRAPGMNSAGQRSVSLVELVDLYPTLCDLAGLPKPDHLHGSSFAKLLDDPGLDEQKFALSQFPRGDAMGHSIRTKDFRYTEWRSIEGGTLTHEALYDLRDGAVETRNVADDESFREIVARLSLLLERERDDQVFH
ncbi:sulfatase [Verrucomicrobiales bacterium BCK34]|nr:sulfatase [Verrucomicrobiales bacterium BCK34]